MKGTKLPKVSILFYSFKLTRMVTVQQDILTTRYMSLNQQHRNHEGKKSWFQTEFEAGIKRHCDHSRSLVKIGKVIKKSSDYRSGPDLNHSQSINHSASEAELLLAGSKVCGSDRDSVGSCTFGSGTRQI